MDEQRESLQGKKIAFFGEFAYWPSYHGATPADIAHEHGAVVWPAVDVGLDYLVLGDKRGNGKAAAKRKAEKLALSPGLAGRLQILSEADYRELVRIDLRGKSFFFAGGPQGFN